MPLFPYKLHELLTEMQSNAHLASIISWLPSGKAFKIHEPELFQEVLLNKYFPRQTKISSFKRQLLYYGFDNLGDSIFAHPCFLKDQRGLCGQINHSNPTKSQREAKTSIPSRRIRGKQAKRALRSRLTQVAASSYAVPMPMLTVSSLPTVAVPLAARFPWSQLSVSNKEAIPLSSIQALVRPCALPSLTTSSTMTEAQSFPSVQNARPPLNQMPAQSLLAMLLCQKGASTSQRNCELSA